MSNPICLRFDDEMSAIVRAVQKKEFITKTEVIRRALRLYACERDLEINTTLFKEFIYFYKIDNAADRI